MMEYRGMKDIEERVQAKELHLISRGYRRVPLIDNNQLRAKEYIKRPVTASEHSFEGPILWELLWLE